MGAGAMNATYGYGFEYGMSSLLPEGTIYFLMAISLLILLMTLLLNDRVLAFILTIKKKLRYTFIGTITMALGFCTYVFCRHAGTQAADGNPEILIWLGAIIGFAVASTLIGWAVDIYFLQKLKRNYKHIKRGCKA